ncbi:DUF6114 domain-containing protein [Antrihabitans spumae]|uniref:DUF6114 domain-containing protein n=1 Tax=Antrihabitans spumae TaxID=3373370 RepID=A0ABW7K370_9NOCA
MLSVDEHAAADSGAREEAAREESAKPGRVAALVASARPHVHSARLWFRGFRRSRPFWGGLWMLIGGWLILRLSMVEFHIMFSAGLTGFGGWLAGGGLIVCGVAAWISPSQRFFAGLIGLLLAIVSFVISNLGGLFIGMVFGIIGSAMTLSWGPTKPRRSKTAPKTVAKTEDDAAPAVIDEAKAVVDLTKSTATTDATGVSEPKPTEQTG